MYTHLCIHIYYVYIHIYNVCMYTRVLCMYTHVLLRRTWRNAQFGEKVIIQMEEKSRDTAAQLKEAIGGPYSLTCTYTLQYSYCTIPLTQQDRYSPFGNVNA